MTKQVKDTEAKTAPAETAASQQTPQEAVKDSETRSLEALQLYAAKNPIIQSYSRTDIDTDIDKMLDSKQAHHTFTRLMMAHIKELDFVFNHNRHRFKTENGSVNTESLMYLMDMFFLWIDKTAKHFPVPPQTSDQMPQNTQEAPQEAP